MLAKGVAAAEMTNTALARVAAATGDGARAYALVRTPGGICISYVLAICILAGPC
jgi:hypothetical protein